jgi:hypothetical protein
MGFVFLSKIIYTFVWGLCLYLTYIYEYIWGLCFVKLSLHIYGDLCLCLKYIYTCSHKDHFQKKKDPAHFERCIDIKL